MAGASDAGRDAFGRWLDATPLPPSNMHTVYVALEALKVLWLLTMGFGGLIAGGDGHRAVRVRRPGAKRTIQAPWRA